MPKILIVDDDENICELLTLYLNSAGFETAACHSAKDALESLRPGDF